MTRFRCTLGLVTVWVFSSIPANAMTFVPMSVEDLTRSSAVTVLGTVDSLTGYKSDDGQIFTLVNVVVDRVVKGNLTASVITLKEPGGTVGGEEEVLLGAPSFERGEEVVVFLTVAADGSMRTNHLALGKFRVEMDNRGRRQAVQRFEPGTTVVIPRGIAPLPESIPLEDLLSEVEGTAPATNPGTDSTASPSESPAAFTVEEFGEPFKFLGSPSRFFEPDDGNPISYLIDQNGDTTLGLASSRQAFDDAFDVWTNVPTATIEIVDGGLTADLTTPCTLGVHKVIFNDPDAMIPAPVNCTGILGVGGYCTVTPGDTKVVNGTTFKRALRGAVHMADGWGACALWTQCNFAEVATHEIGHTIGLGHSGDDTATMFSTCACDGSRCALLGTDDINGVTFIYPPASPHDSVVLPVNPVTVTLAEDTLSVAKTVKVKVRNADAEAFGVGHEIQLSATTADCPGGTIAGLPDFDTKTAGAQDSVILKGGKSKPAKIPLLISSAAFATFNSKAPKRCTITFTANTINEPGNVDPYPSNDTVTMELNVIDKNDPGMSAVHESVIKSLKPLTLTIVDDALSKVKTAKPAALNADILPQTETPGHSITVTLSDDCPGGTLGVVDYDPDTGGSQNTVLLKGGASASGKLAVTATSAAFATPNRKSPLRCTAVLTATGPGGDSDSTNNTTKLVIDVIDKNDF